MDTLERRLVDAVAAFEDAWSPSSAPDAVREFAAACPDLAPALERELIGVDFACRWDAGLGLPVEVYLHRHFPSYTGDAELKLDLICAEMLHVPSEPDAEKYAARFPDVAAEVRRLFQVYRELGRGPLEPAARSVRPGSQSARRQSERTAPAGPVLHSAPSATEGSLQLADDYRLGEALGEGSFKTVLKAMQVSTRRVVAVKLLRQPGGGALPAATGRFVSEGRTQARLDHQNIPPVFVLGPRPDAPTALVEKLVPGRPWSQTIHERPLEDNLRILLEVSKALAYSHRQHGIIHRDVKPENVMAGDGYGEVYLVDWGLALHVGERREPDQPAPHRSDESGVSGTPAYMAPEMATGRPQVCTTATDVFLLGAVLYEVLAGTPPYRGGARAALVRAAGAVIDPPEERAPDRAMPRELVRVAMRAMAREPSERYADAAAFADAVQHYLRRADAERQCESARRRLEEIRKGLPTLERSGGPLHPAVPWLIEVADQFHQARMHWLPEGGGKPGSGPPVGEEDQGYREAVAGEEAARLELAELALKTGDFGLAEAQLDLAETLPGGAAERVPELRARVRGAAAQRRRQKRLLYGTAATAAALLLVSLAAVVYGQVQERRGAEAEAGKVRAEAASARAEAAQAQERQHAAEQIARAARRRADALPLLEKAAAARAQGFHQAAAAFLASALVQTDTPELRTRWTEDLQLSLVPVRTSSRRLRVGPLVYSPDGRFLASGDMDTRAIRLWRTDTGEQALALYGHGTSEEMGSTVAGLAFLPRRSDELISVGTDGTVRRWDLARGLQIGLYPAADRPPPPPYRTVAVEPGQAADRRRFVTGDAKGKLAWWNVASLTPMREVQAHKGRVNAVRFRADGGECASAGDDGTVRFWDREGKLRASLSVPVPSTGKPVILYDAAWSPDGKEIAAAANDGHVYLWDVAARRLRLRLEGHEVGGAGLKWARTVAYLSATRLVSGGADGTIRLWDVRTGEQLAKHPAHATDLIGVGVVGAVAVRPDGRELASAGADGAIRVWDASGAPRARLMGMECGEQNFLEGVASALCPERNLLVVSGRAHDATLRTFDARSLQEKRSYFVPGTTEGGRMPIPATALAIHPDGSSFVSGEATGELLVWETATGKEVVRLKGHTPRDLFNGFSVAVSALAWSPDGSRIASAGFDRSLKVWEPRQGKPPASWADEAPEAPARPGQAGGTPAAARFLAFDRGGTHLLTAGQDALVRRWDIGTQKVVGRLRGHMARITAASLSADGRLLASGSEDGTVVLWDLAKDTPLRTINVRPTLDLGPLGISGPAAEARADPGRAFGKRLSPGVEALALSPDRRLLAVVLAEGTLSLIDTASGTLLYRGTGHEGSPVGLGMVTPYFTKDGTLLTVGSDGIVRRWDLARWPRSRRRLDATRSARLLAASPDGKEWAAITAERTFVRWGRAGKVLEVAPWLDGDRPNAVAYVPGRRQVVVGQYLGGCVVLDLDTGKPAARRVGRPRTAGAEAVTAVAVLHDGALAASNWVDGAIDFWHVKDGAPLRTLVQQPPPAKEGAVRRAGRVCALAFRPDGRQLATVDTEGTLNLWTTADWCLEFAGSGPPQSEVTCALVYSPDGRRLVQAGQDQRIVVWDPHTRKRVQELRAHRRVALGNDVDAASVCRAAFSADGKWLATCGGDGTVRLWDAGDADAYRLVATLGTVGLHSYRATGLGGKDVLPSPTVRAALLAVAFSADGKELVAGGWDAPVRLWDLAEVLAELRRPATELLAETERRTGQRRQGSRLVPIQYNRLVPVDDAEAP